MTINFLLTWKSAGIPPKDTLKALTINGYKAADVFKRNGVITIDRLLHPGPVNGFRRR